MTKMKEDSDDTCPQKGATVVVLPAVQSGKLEDAEREAAAVIPEWGELDNGEKRELARLILAQRERATPPTVKLAESPSGGTIPQLEGKSQALTLLRLQKVFATNSLDATNARMMELQHALKASGALNDIRMNAALSFMEAMGPTDQAECLLLMQMYATHGAAMRAIGEMGKAQYADGMASFGNLATKLLRTSQAQMETLARMRRGGEQVVRHIHVDNRGGQAVIAETVNTGGQGNGKADGQPYAAAAAAVGASAALPSPNPVGWDVSVTSVEGKEAVPDARRR